MQYTGFHRVEKYLNNERTASSILNTQSCDRHQLSIVHPDQLAIDHDVSITPKNVQQYICRMSNSHVYFRITSFCNTSTVHVSTEKEQKLMMTRYYSFHFTLPKPDHPMESYDSYDFV